MRKLLGFLLVLLLIGVSVSCQDENANKSALEGNVYRGVIPCADCAGIAFTVSLQNEGHYKTSSMYIGESSRKFIETGSWKIKQDTLLILKHDTENDRLFYIKDNKLVMLKADGAPVTSALAENYVLHKADSTARKNICQDERENGIDFHAAGNEPSWSLSIDFDESMVFHNLSGDTIKVPVPEMKADEQSKARLLQAGIETDSLTVALFPVGCVDDMSGWVYDYHVNVNVNSKRYFGCGDFINPEYRLNEFWALYSLNGRKIDKENLSSTIPFLQFAVAKQKVYGNTGCNLLSGNISMQDSSISFSKMITTKRACMGQNLEQPFLEALSNANNFEISNGELILLNQTDTLMVFRKAE